jgi:CheY-like chemotaxis protein
MPTGLLVPSTLPGWSLRPWPPCPSLAPDTDPGAGSIPRKPRLLVVDDDWLIAIQIEHHLQDAGYEVVGTAADAAEAVRLAGCKRPDLVLIDIRLRGGSDGVAAAREILERFAIPSLFVSAHADAGTRARAQASRPLGWVQKPFTVGELVTAVAKALDAG